MSRPSAPAVRSAAILHAIVQTYIETGEPVASRTIARRLKGHLSAATIRNVMADLYEDGYLSQPHTSAGRIPTGKAFQNYVKSLAAQQLLATEIEKVQRQLGLHESIQSRVERSSHVLMEMTRGMGIAAAIPAGEQTLHQVDLLPLGEHRVLMIVVTGDRSVHNRVVTLNENFTAEELQSIRNYLNLNFSGWELPAVRDELERRLEQASAAYDAILKKLQVLYAKGLLILEASPEIYFEGVSNLLGLDLHLTREKFRELFRALEQKKKILHLLERFLEQPHGEVAVQVGLSEAHPTMSELSLIGVTVTLPNGLSGKIAVLGPLRIDYERCMSAVIHVACALQSSPS